MPSSLLQALLANIRKFSGRIRTQTNQYRSKLKNILIKYPSLATTSLALSIDREICELDIRVTFLILPLDYPYFEEGEDPMPKSVSVANQTVEYFTMSVQPPAQFKTDFPAWVSSVDLYFTITVATGT